MKKILIIDDDHGFMTSLSNLLKETEYVMHGVSSVKEAIEKVSSENFDLILLDVIMPETNGIDFLPEIRRHGSMTPVIMITGFPSTEDAVEATKRGACDYITKPFKPEELFYKIGKAIEKSRFEKYLKEFDHILNSLSNPIRRDILRLISSRSGMHLSDITRELKISDHTKAIFHLKILKESGVLEHKADKSYVITPEGVKVLDCLKIIENYLSKQ